MNTTQLHQNTRPVSRSFPAMRKSHSAQQSFEMEMQRLRRMSIEERVREALEMQDRFAWLAPSREEKGNHG